MNVHVYEVLVKAFYVSKIEQKNVMDTKSL